MNLVLPQQKLKKSVDAEEPFIFISGISVFYGNKEKVLNESVSPEPITCGQKALREMELRVLSYKNGYVFRRPYFDSEVVQHINSDFYDYVLPVADFKIFGRAVLALEPVVYFLPKMLHICCHNEISCSQICFENSIGYNSVLTKSKCENFVGDKTFSSKYDNKYVNNRMFKDSKRNKRETFPGDLLNE